MDIKQINEKDPDKVFILVKNGTASSLSVGAAVDFEHVTATDGVTVTAARSDGDSVLFAGVVTPAAIAAGSYGLCQVYGICAALVSGVSGGIAVKTFLRSKSGILVADTLSGAIASGAIRAALMETATASTAASVSTYVFLRAM